MTYPLSFLADYLRSGMSRPTMVRRDEMSGSGDGQCWAAQLAPPFWEFDLSLSARYASMARAADARIWALGVNSPFLFVDPGYDGAVYGDPGAAVVLSSIGGARDVIGLSGLPSGYVVTPGDRLSIAHSSGRYYLGAVAVGATANASGAAVGVQITPAVHFGVTTGLAVEMRNPVMRATVVSYDAFQAVPGFIGQAATLKIQQKI